VLGDVGAIANQGLVAHGACGDVVESVGQPLTRQSAPDRALRALPLSRSFSRNRLRRRALTTA
jgi:hypothetical protein